MAQLPRRMMPHHITVKPYLGEDARGPVYGPPVSVRCSLRSKRRMVRDQTGAEVVSEGLASAAPDAATVAVARSLVTLPDGRETSVLVCKPNDDGGAGAWQHTKIFLA
ncbi:MAG TPA: hypothetical protein VGL93_10530 [Streptosporangiaceae bacterium]|jgi:hypothetical protein